MSTPTNYEVTTTVQTSDELDDRIQNRMNQIQNRKIQNRMDNSKKLC